MEKDLVNSLDVSIRKSDLSNLVKIGSEIALDNVLKDGLLKDIPVFNTLVQVYNATNQIREEIFTKKVYRFLFEINDITIEKRREFIKRLERDKVYKRKVGETLVILLDRLDNMEKPIIIGKLFKACIEEKISYKMFLRLSSIVDKSFLPDLKVIADNYPNSYLTNFLRDIQIENLYNLGILKLNITNKKKIDSKTGLRTKNTEKLKYSINEFGHKLIKIGLNY